MSISTEGMLVALHMGVWDGFKFDKDASRKVVEDAGASEGSARVNKMIVPPEVLKEVKGTRSAIYDHFIKHTLPWKDTGERLLMRRMYASFIEAHERLVDNFMASVDHLVTVKYPSARDQAAFRMAALFKSGDYPHPDELRAKFYARLNIDAVTEAGDFRCTLKSEQVDAIKAKIEAAMSERLSTAQAHVWDRISKAVEHFHARMSDTEGRLFDSVKDNLFALIDVLPGLNVLNDPELDRMGTEIKRRLQSFEIKEMRKNPSHRKDAAAEAEKLVVRMREKMKSLMIDTQDDDEE